MALSAVAIGSYIAGAAFVALAIWLIWLKFESKVNQTFALFLLLVAMRILLFGFIASANDKALETTLKGLQPYVRIATPPALAMFLAAHAARLGKPHYQRAAEWTGLVALGVLFASLAWYLADHCSLLCGAAPPRWGPLALAAFSLPVMQGLAAVYFAWHMRSVHSEGARMSSRLMAIAFASWSLLDGGLSTLQILHHGWESYSAHYQNSLWLPLAFFLQPLGSVIGAVAVWMLVADATPRRALRAALAPIFAVAAAVYVEWVPDEPQYLADTGNLTILALRIFFAVLVVVALVRHRLFDLDVRIRWTISRGWVAGIFLLVFFTVANVAENALDEKFGLLFGGIATGLLFFALNPLERFGQRIADAAVPHKKGPQEMAKDDRLRLYEDQARLVWADGTMGRKERALLDQLRQHLHLDAETAARIEHEAALGHLERAAST